MPKRVLEVRLRMDRVRSSGCSADSVAVEREVLERASKGGACCSDCSPVGEVTGECSAEVSAEGL